MRTEVVPPDSWREPLSQYGELLTSAGRSADSIKLRNYQLRCFARAVGCTPYEVTTDNLVEYLSRPGWGRNTRRSARTALRGFYGWATATDRIPRDPTRTLLSIPVDLGKPRPASDDALSLGLLAARTDVTLMIRLGAHAGLRCCEIARVRSDHVEYGRGGYSLRVRGKGDKVRMVPLSPGLAHQLLEYRGVVFPGQIDGHLSAGYVSKLISEALPEGVTAHMLRHRFASRAYAGSKDIRAVQELLGHASVSTTQVYTAVDDDDLRRAAAAAA